MEISIHREEGMWTAHVGPTVYPLVPDSGSIVLLAKAISNVYPEAKVKVDPRLMENPFVYRRLLAGTKFGIEPDYIRLEYSLRNSEVKTCGYCGHNAWYNAYWNYYPGYGGWECTDWRCAARMYADGTWYKLSKWAKK